MYIDPNTGGILFHVLAGILATISGALFFFSRKIREGLHGCAGICVGMKKTKNSFYRLSRY